MSRQKSYRFIGYFKNYAIVKDDAGNMYYLRYDDEPFPPGDIKGSEVEPIYHLKDEEQEEIFLLFEE